MQGPGGGSPPWWFHPETDRKLEISYQSMEHPWQGHARSNNTACGMCTRLEEFRARLKWLACNLEGMCVIRVLRHQLLRHSYALGQLQQLLRSLTEVEYQCLSSWARNKHVHAGARRWQSPLVVSP
jgi:hypothetical protein